jgi:DNA-binding LacI/PurR family transcriptional regulator
MDNESNNGNSKKQNGKKQVTLKDVADHVGLTPGTISAVLNNAAASQRIPQTTRDRIMSAARELNYQPNVLARALRTGRALVSPDPGQLANDRGALVIVGADQFLGRAIHAIQQAGLRVPDDLTVVGYDGFPVAELGNSVAAAEPKPT